jgi:T5SS/PEP-CTERM-associated repeat protein/autotransporter-associated beta strand protein
LPVILGGVFVFATGRIHPAAAACASDNCWIGQTGADWFLGTNWSTGAVPSSATNIIVDRGNPFPDPSIGINGISNAASSNSALIGDVAGATGNVTVSTTNAGLPASWVLGGAGGFNGNLVTGPLMVGVGGTGSLTITNGGAVSTTGNLGNVVIGSVGTGTVTVGSATAPNLANLSTLTNNGPAFEAGRLIIGDTGTGTLIINPDGVVSGFLGATLGHGSGGQGTVIVNGGSLDVIDPHFGLGDMDVGLAGLGTLTVQNGGTLTSISGVIADQTGSSGSSVTVTGANSTWNIIGGSNLGSLTVGNSEAGSLSILAGGIVNAAGINSIDIGPTPNSSAAGTGAVLVDDGKLIAYGGTLYVGVAGNPGSTMTVQNGGQVVTDGASIGGFSPASFNGNSNATGAVMVTGVGSLWDAARDGANGVDTNTNQFEGTNQFFIDNPTSMTGLVIQKGGQVIDNAAFVGDFSPGSVNTVVVDGVGSKWTNLTSLSVGYFQFGFGSVDSTGAVNISNGAQVSAPSINVGVLPDGGSGHVDSISVSGSGSSLQTSGTLAVGLFGTGNLTVSGGATVTSSVGIIGYSSAAPGSLTLTEAGGGNLDTNNVGANSIGSVLVTGAGSSWSTGSLIIGENASSDPNFTGIGGGNASGTLTVANAGAVDSTAAIQVALNAGSTGTINIGAADGQAAAAPGAISAPAIVFGAGTGTIVFNHTSTNYVFGIPIEGSGSVIVDSGTTVFTATNTYTGATNIDGGALEVNGSIADSSLTSVNAGALLFGTGTVAKTQINNGGLFAPGNGTPGTSMTVAGNLTFEANAAYLVVLNPTTASFANVTGNVSLNGTVDAVFLSGVYTNKTYDILHSGGLNGTTFTGLVTSGTPNFDVSLSYSATDVFLNLTAALGTGTPLNVNQQNVANTLNAFFNSGGTLTIPFANVFNLTGANLANALTAMDGENATGAEHSAFQLMNEFLNLMLDPYVDGRIGRGGGGPLGFAPDQQAGLPPDIARAYAGVLKAPPKQNFEQRWTAWAAGFGGGATAKGDPVVGSNNVTTGTFGYAAGMDYHVSPHTMLGFALAGGGTGWNLAQGLGTGRSDAFLAGLYGVTHQGPIYLAGALAFANNWFTTNRTALGDQLTAEFQGQSYAARLEGGYRFVVPVAYNSIGLTPYAAIQAQNFHTPSFSETDPMAGGFGLTYAAMNGTDTRSELGARLDDPTLLGHMPLILRARAAWAHDWVGNPALNASFESLPGTSFTVFGAPIPHDSALTSAGAQLFFTPNWSLLAKFDGEFAQRSQTYAGSGTLRYAW